MSILRLSFCLCLVGFVSVSASAQCCGVVSENQAYQVQYGSVQAPVEVKTYKKEMETQYREETVTTYKTVWDTVPQTTKVARQVPETRIIEERYKVLKPVWTTEYRDESYEVTRYVPETSEREERVVVSKPVLEMEHREIMETVRKPVQQTVFQEKRYTVQRPVTTYENRTVDKGGYVDSVKTEPGRTYNRLTWQSGGTHLDPATGQQRYRLPGLYWTPLTSDPKQTVEKVYKPNIITEQVPVTTYKPETIVEQVPVNVTTYQDEQVTRVEPVQVQRMIQEEVVKRVPVTTYKPIVERIEKIVPVQVYRMEEQEVVREIPRTTYKTILEEQVREVKVPRQVREVQVVRKPVQVERWVPVTTTINSAKPVAARLPTGNETVTVERKIPDTDEIGDEFRLPSLRKSE